MHGAKLLRMLYQCALFCALVCLPVYSDDRYPYLSGDFAEGRVVWLENCETCHAYGTAGAPNPLKPPEWTERVKKPVEILYEHAIQGFYGKSDTYMPPRGGNPDLSDVQVRSAVDYMLALAFFYLSDKEN